MCFAMSSQTYAGICSGVSGVTLGHPAIVGSAIVLVIDIFA
jgi:hypothetical protein